MALPVPTPEVLDFVSRVARVYAKLTAHPHAEPESGLGGNLLYAGELDTTGRVLVVAANISGAATLVASADRSAQKQAIRDGVADFLVTSLDEALRILKNQLRKRETVSVCVAAEPAAVEREMNERGVLPNLQRSAIADAQHSSEDLPALLTWSVAAGPAQWLPQLDAVALECLRAEDWAARRWLRLAPRYLGRMAQGIHALACSQEFASSFIKQVQTQVHCGEINLPVEIRRRDPRGQEEKHIFEPVSL